MDSGEDWPALNYSDWQDTCATLHRWLQIAGKVRLALSPHINHCWEATFYVTASGLTSSAVPLPGGQGVFEMFFDFLHEEVRISTSHGTAASVPLRPCSVAAFETEFLAALDALHISVKIWNMPVEIPNPVRFDQDRAHCSYDAEAVRRWWRILVSCERVFTEFRSGFQGKCSPVHLFWGSMDIAVTRFSGRPAPPRPDDPAFMQDAYSHEVSSAGFWPGNDEFPRPVFYSYAVPAPPGFDKASVHPASAGFNAQLGEFILSYDDVRQAPSGRAMVLDFLQSTYAAAADLAHWDRAALERAR